MPRRVGFLLGAGLALAAGPALALTFYVRATGDDGRDGRSPASAFATITRGASKAGGGDTVVVGPGRYPEGNITPLGNGRRKELVRFVADRDGSQTGDPPGEVLVDATGFEVGFRIASRPWVVVSGFSVTGASEEGIAVKSSSDHSVVANCLIFSNRGRGVWVRDSRSVVVFNSLIYSNGGSGIDFGGEGHGSAGGVALGNTIFANSLDGIRLEGLVPSPRGTLLQNVIAQNLGRGINLKARSANGFVGQWNLNIDGYGSEATPAAFDLTGTPSLLDPSGGDQILGRDGRGDGHLDDDFRLRQLPAGQAEQSVAVDGSPFRAAWFHLDRATTHSGGAPDVGRADLGFHYGGKADFVSGFGGRVERRIQKLRARATQCERLGVSARIGRVQCVAKAAVFSRLEHLCALQSVGLCQ
jgi:parallel beta-helix repeat protein